MEERIIQPVRNEIKIKGKLSYSESNQAWNTIRFKKEFVNEFSQLKEKTSSFGYKMIFYRSYNQLEKTISRSKRKKEPIPVLMFFYKEK
jgi:hypothetical protein